MPSPGPGPVTPAPRSPRSPRGRTGHPAPPPGPPGPPGPPDASDQPGSPDASGPRGSSRTGGGSAPGPAARPIAHHAGPARPLVAQVPHRVGFWFAAAAFTAVMAFGTAPTPLWPLYQRHDGFGPGTTTVAFAMLVVGAAVGFLALGHLSDRLGRRRIVVPSLITAVAAALVLALWPQLPGLLAGRLLDGIAVGLMSSTATTYLHDLHAQEHPGRPHSPLPGLVATAATLGGLALGPLTAGVLAQWGPRPLLTTQLAFAAAMAVCLVLALATPETVDRQPRTAAATGRFALRPGGAAGFASAAALGFFSFAVLGLISAMGAVLLHGRLGVSAPFVTGLAAFLMFGAAAGGLLALWRLPLSGLLVGGALAFPAGLALVVLSLYHPALWLYLVAVSVAGLGAGALFKGGLGTAGAAASPGSRAGVLALFFVVSYTGMGLPPVLFGLTLRALPIGAATLLFAAVLSAGAALSVAAALAARGRSGAGGRSVPPFEG